MDIHRLEVFCKVVELKSFTKAAEAIFLSQPTVSEHIRSLEAMLDEKLVDRLGRKVMPTQAGRILYTYAKKIIKLRSDAVEALNEYSGKLAGQLQLGASTIPGTYSLPALIGSFKKRYPAVNISLKISNSRLIVEDVLEGNVELGVVGAKLNEPSLEWVKAFSDELVLVVGTDHPWAKKDFVAPVELMAEPFILREKNSGTRKVMGDILAEHSIDISNLTVVAEMGSTEAVRQSIKAGIGVSIMSKQAVVQDVDCGALAIVPVKGIYFKRPFYLIRLKKRHESPICRMFLEHLQA